MTDSHRQFLGLLITILGFFVVFTLNYSITLEANLKTCFFENLNATESFGINYELIPEPGGVNVGRKTVDLEVNIKFYL
jgi:hypothetical protein